MSITTLSSRAFNQNASRAKQMAYAGHVFITNHGKPTHVLLNIEDYHTLTGQRPKIADLLVLPGTENRALDLPKLGDLAQAADFS